MCVCVCVCLVVVCRSEKKPLTFNHLPGMEFICLTLLLQQGYNNKEFFWFMVQNFPCPINVYHTPPHWNYLLDQNEILKEWQNYTLCVCVCVLNCLTNPWIFFLLLTTTTRNNNKKPGLSSLFKDFHNRRRFFFSLFNGHFFLELCVCVCVSWRPYSQRLLLVNEYDDEQQQLRQRRRRKKRELLMLLLRIELAFFPQTHRETCVCVCVVVVQVFIIIKK